jgi:hypothetical protein
MPQCVSETLFSFVVTLNEFVSMKLNAVHVKTLLTCLSKAYLQSHRNKIKCKTLNLAYLKWGGCF